MKFLSGCVLCLALSATGCVEMPLWKESKPIAPAPAAKPKPMLPPVTADEIDETNGRAKAEVLRLVRGGLASLAQLVDDLVVRERGAGFEGGHRGGSRREGRRVNG